MIDCKISKSLTCTSSHLRLYTIWVKFQISRQWCLGKVHAETIRWRISTKQLILFVKMENAYLMITSWNMPSFLVIIISERTLPKWMNLRKRFINWNNG